MESNGGYDSSHMDGDVRLPPRKRLLAGLKKQSVSESTSQCSQDNNPSSSLSPSIDQNPLSEFEVRLSSLLKLYKNGSNMSPEDIALAAKAEAEIAAKAAEAARAVAEEKAAIAAKAVAAAKSALSLVAYEEKRMKNKHQKKKKRNDFFQSFESCGDDEEIARTLHRAMNSSTRISKNSPESDSKSHKHKKLKMSSPNGKSGVSNGTSMRDGDVTFPNGDAEEESNFVNVNEKVSESSKDGEVEVDSIGGEAESSQKPMEKNYEGIDESRINGRKRGRIKQKKLPLSICSSKDQANPKEELKSTNSLLMQGDSTEVSAARHLSLLSVGPSAENVTPMEVAPTWKCQDFNVSQCIKQDKLVES